VRDALKYKPPNLDQYREKGWLAYVESALRHAHDDANGRQRLEERSKLLQGKEETMYNSRERERRAAGFPV
jgi:hypothetical protein